MPRHTRNAPFYGKGLGMSNMLHSHDSEETNSPTANDTSSNITPFQENTYGQLGVNNMQQTIIPYDPNQNNSNTLTTEQALEAYMKAESNVHLAAERCRVPLSVFMDTLAQDHIGLQRLLRTRMLLNMFSAFELSQNALSKAIPLMDSEDVAKTFIGIASVLEKLTATQQANVNVNIHEYMMRMLPPEAREAFAILTAPPESTIKLSDD